MKGPCRKFRFLQWNEEYHKSFEQDNCLKIYSLYKRVNKQHNVWIVEQMQRNGSMTTTQKVIMTCQVRYNKCVSQTSGDGFERQSIDIRDWPGVKSDMGNEAMKLSLESIKFDV